MALARIRVTAVVFDWTRKRQPEHVRYVLEMLARYPEELAAGRQFQRGWSRGQSGSLVYERIGMPGRQGKIRVDLTDKVDKNAGRIAYESARVNVGGKLQHE